MHLVIDYQWTKRLQDQLRHALYACYDSQVDFEEKNPRIGQTDEIEKIKNHLKSFKLILVDEVKPDETALILELRHNDTLHYATKQLESIELFKNNYGGENQNSQILQEILQRHKVVLALIRLLVLPHRVDLVLSTRATGTYVSIV